jgi:hypothetical protein
MLEGKISGGGSPGGLPLILRFSRNTGWQPVWQWNICPFPVNPIRRWGTLILVTLFLTRNASEDFSGPCAIFPDCLGLFTSFPLILLLPLYRKETGRKSHKSPNESKNGSYKIQYSIPNIE